MNERGFTLLELTVTAVLAVGSVLSFNQLSFLHLLNKRKTQAVVQNQLEHRTVKDFVQSVISNSLTSLMCSAPHPYKAYSARLNVCYFGLKPDGVTYYTQPTAAEMTSWHQLGDALYEWAITNTARDGRVDRVLDPVKFATVVKPLLAANQCLTCHNGSGTPPYLNRDFADYNSWQLSPPLISSIPFATPVGQRMVRSIVTLPSMEVGNYDTVHEVRFFTDADCDSSDLVPMSRVYNSAPTCAANAIDLCRYPNASSCGVTCTSTGGGNSSTAPSCTQWTLKVDCRVPRTECTDPLPCPATFSLAPGTCAENQPSPTCGDGATTWHCIDPLFPSAAQPVKFSVSTFFTDPTSGDRTKYWSGGVLP